MDEAISHGIKSTAGVVTSAAIVMVAVFSIFATLSLLMFKQFGVGLAAAILIRDTRPRRAPARDDEAARRAELVPPSLAPMAPALRPRPEVSGSRGEAGSDLGLVVTTDPGRESPRPGSDPSGLARGRRGPFGPLLRAACKCR
jgi:hypothetical protein